MIASSTLQELVLDLRYGITRNLMLGLQFKEVAPALRTIECNVRNPHATNDPERYKSLFTYLQARVGATMAQLENLRVTSCGVDVLKEILYPQAVKNIIGMSCFRCRERRKKGKTRKPKA